MRIIQIGDAKSGNFWLYKILQNIQDFAGLEKRSYIQAQPIYSVAVNWELSYENQAGIDVLDIDPDGYYSRISSIYRMPIENLDEYLSQTSHIWSHSSFCEHTQNALSKIDKIIYLIRDPRDRAISAAKFRFTPYGYKYFSPKAETPEEWLDNRFERLINRWVDHVGGYLARGEQLGIHFVYYERFLHAFDQELQDLLTYLDIKLDSKDIEKIKEKVHFSSMKAKDPNHVRKGKSGKWRDSLTVRQNKISDRYAGPLMKYLGYPLAAEDTTDLPGTPDMIDVQLVQRAVASSALKLKLHRLRSYIFK